MERRRADTFVIWREYPILRTCGGVGHSFRGCSNYDIKTQKTLIGREPVSPRMIWSKFKNTHERKSLNIIQCYAPTNDTDEDTKEEFYQLLDETFRKCRARVIPIFIGDINIKVGTDNIGFDETIGRKGLGTMDEDGELCASLCDTYNLTIGGAIFPHKRCHLATGFFQIWEQRIK